MTEKNLKAFFALLILFFIDLVKPFGYTLLSEFLFLGIIFVSINYSLKTALFLSIIFGYLKDAASTGMVTFGIFEYSIVAILIHYFLNNFRKTTAKIFIFYGALIMDIIANSIYINKTPYIFSLIFIIHSSVIFVLLNYLLSLWLKIPLREHE